MDDSACMKDLGEKIAAVELLMLQPLQELIGYYEAKGVKPAAEVERLRIHVESLTTAVHEFYQRALRGAVQTLDWREGSGFVPGTGCFSSTACIYSNRERADQTRVERQL